MTADTADTTAAPDRVAWAVRRAHEMAESVPEGLSGPQGLPSGGGRVAARPVPLERFIAAANAAFDEIAGLTAALAGAHLLRWGIEQSALMDDATPLAGFVFANATSAYILVNRNDPLARRRFTAAHELGHLLLHLPARSGIGSAGEDAGEVARLTGEAIADSPEKVIDAVYGQISDDDAGPEAGATGLSLPWREREANRFAAELLMPEPVVRAMHAHYTRHYGPARRFLESHLASDLMVSRQAVQFRLADLGLSEEAALEEP